MPVLGVRPPDVGDIISLDPDTLRTMRLDQLLAMMRQCGISTVGIDSLGAAATRLIERGAISPGS
jgi:hypothetical protein